jgi:hypothetical protein
LYEKRADPNHGPRGHLRKALLLITAAAALSACAGVDRPEGVVERWLTAIGQGPTGEPEVYASKELADDLVPPPREESSLEVIEVGKGSVSGTRARVPFRIQVPDGTPETHIAELSRVDGDWQIVRVARPDSELKIPTQGGERIGKASLAVWLGGALTGLAMMVVVAIIMKLVTAPPTQTRPQAPTN